MAGSGGMLGEAFFLVFSEEYDLKCTDIDVNEDWLTFTDFRDLQSYKKSVKNFHPDFLFHIGAFTDLEFCEENVEETYRTNTDSVENAINVSNELNIPLLYISTAGIFDGSKEIFDDWDEPSPMCHYAKSKYEGEKLVLSNSKRFLICRAGWMMGGGPKKDKKFINKIMKQIKEGKKELFIVNDKSGTPTYTHDFAENVKILLESEDWGLYNMVCEGLTGRMEVTQELLRILNLEREIKITPVSSDYWEKEYYAIRPDSERLINAKLNSRGMNIMRDWKICLKEYVQSYYQDYF